MGDEKAAARLTAAALSGGGVTHGGVGSGNGRVASGYHHLGDNYITGLVRH